MDISAPDRLPRPLVQSDGPARRLALAALITLPLAGGIAWGLPDASLPARAALGGLVACIVGWSVLRLGELRLAGAACAVLVLAGAVPPQVLVDGLLGEPIFLLLGAFVLAAALQHSGLAERFTMRAIAGAGSTRALFHRLNVAIGVTAFLIPSTSARAALLLPVFMAIAPALPGPRPVRALALLFPTSILLTAGASLMGAGAHLVAVEFLARETGLRLGWLSWAALALPFAALTSGAATELILRLFLDAEERRSAPGLPPQSVCEPLTRTQRGTLGVASLTVALWCLDPWLQLGAMPIALAGAAAALCPALTGLDHRRVRRHLDVRLLLFLAATTVLGTALLDTGAASLLAGLALQAAPLTTLPPWVLIAIAAVLSVVLHLVVPSRTARTVLLLPTIALPLAAAGADLALLALVCVQGSGFCQSWMAGAKPVAVFARAGTSPPFGPADLWRLSLWLAPTVVVSLLLFATCIWPRMGIS